MSNKLPPMHSIKTMQEQSDQKKQLDLQRQSFIVNTRLRLTENFLNTLLGRLDIEVEKDDYKEILTDIAIGYANTLMNKLGIVFTSNIE